MSGCQPCPPPTPQPCPQVCPPPPPPPACRVKPIMRGLHRQQVKGTILQTFILMAIGGSCYYFFVSCPRIEKYKVYYEKADLYDWADIMARQGLFQSVPKGGFPNKEK